MELTSRVQILGETWRSKKGDKSSWVCFRIPLLFLSDWPTVRKQQPIRFKSSVLPSFWQIALKTQFWLFWREQSSDFSVQNSPKVVVNKSSSCDSLFREPRLWAVNILQTVQQGSASPRSLLMPSLPWYESHAKDFAHRRQSNDWRAFPVTDNFHVWLWHVMTLMESPQIKRQEVLMEHSNNEPCLNCWCGCSVKRRPVLERDRIFITMGRGLRSNGMLAFHTSKWWYLRNLTFSAKCCTSIKRKLLLWELYRMPYVCVEEAVLRLRPSKLSTRLNLIIIQMKNVLWID